MNLAPQCINTTTLSSSFDNSQGQEKASVTLSLALLNRLLNWACQECENPEDIYKVVESLSLPNDGIVDLDSWNTIVPCYDEVEEIQPEETVVEPEINTELDIEEPANDEVIEISDEEFAENQPEEVEEIQPAIQDLFDDGEEDGQQALKQYQMRFNIAPEEPSFENPVLDNDGLTPELEDAIKQVLANC